ncbi:unnamed protein product, partial [Mesorhabditis belari]|uniref:Uncharacterized protein n=1 Tax=Mesorhabditis belari TaxID=2138241 RepID=A0AAF3ENX4_9BILA
MLPKSIENSRVWQKFGDLFCVLFITILLLAIYIPVHNIYSPSWVIGIYSFASFDLLAAPTQPDIDGKFVGDASFVLLTITDWSQKSDRVTRAESMLMIQPYLNVLLLDSETTS